MKLNNKIAIVTGGASGIGAAVADRFARHLPDEPSRRAGDDASGRRDRGAAEELTTTRPRFAAKLGKGSV